MYSAPLALPLLASSTEGARLRELCPVTWAHVPLIAPFAASRPDFVCLPQMAALRPSLYPSILPGYLSLLLQATDSRQRAVPYAAPRGMHGAMKQQSVGPNILFPHPSDQSVLLHFLAVQSGGSWPRHTDGFVPLLKSILRSLRQPDDFVFFSRSPFPRGLNPWGPVFTATVVQSGQNLPRRRRPFL